MFKVSINRNKSRYTKSCKVFRLIPNILRDMLINDPIYQSIKLSKKLTFPSKFTQNYDRQLGRYLSSAYCLHSTFVYAYFAYNIYTKINHFDGSADDQFKSSLIPADV